MRSRRRLPFSCVILLAVAGCGTAGPAGGRASDSDEPLVSCGGDPPGWPVDAMDGGIEPQVDREDIVRALEETVIAAPMDAPAAFRERGVEDGDWFVLAETDDTVMVATGAWSVRGPEADADIVRLERDIGRWRHSGWGQCSVLRPVESANSSWVEIRPARPAPERTATTIDVLVNELQCASARDPRPFLREPTVVEQADSVTISWTSEPVEGGADCQGRAGVRQRVELATPLGDRSVRDGSTWPPRTVYGGRNR